MRKGLEFYMKDTMQVKNNELVEMPDIDISGILPNFKIEFDFKAMREYCKKKGIKLRDLTDDETEQFLLNN